MSNTIKHYNKQTTPEFRFRRTIDDNVFIASLNSQKYFIEFLQEKGFETVWTCTAKKRNLNEYGYVIYRNNEKVAYTIEKRTKVSLRII